MGNINDQHIKNDTPVAVDRKVRPVGTRAMWSGERRSWWRRNAPQWLTTLPPNVHRDEAKVFFIRFLVPIIGGLLHLALVLIYLFLDIPGMAYLNMASVAVFIVAALVVRSGRHYLGAGISVLEVCIHSPAVTYLLGLKAGYLVFNYIVAMAAALVYPKKEVWERFGVVIYAMVSSLVAIYLLRDRTPMILLPPEKLEAIFYLICTSTFLALVGFAAYFVRVTDSAEQRVARELERSDQLLLNILPSAIATRLKASPGTIADSFPSVSVLFADIVGFTKLSEKVSGTDIVDLLNEIFSIFDRIAERYGLEKIKTIGDAYMVVGGIPLESSDHAERVTSMALEMVAAVAECEAQRITKIEVRVGVHSGPVVAGVIGEKKFAYDLWGDTVNIASRMESHGAPGRVQISAATRALLGDKFEIEDRGEIDVKGKGLLRTHYVNRERATEKAA